jgi:hypothetical protein
MLSMRIDAAVPPLPASTAEDSMERIIGRKAAALASAIAEGLLERAQDGRMRLETKRRGVEALVELIPLARCWPNFAAVARERSKEMQ